MRFRANIDNVPTFYKIAQTIAALQKKCIIKFTPATMHIICHSAANESGIQVWSSVKVPSLFTDYKIQSNADNEISLLLSAEALVAALRSVAGGSGGGGGAGGLEAADVVMKLAKKNDLAVLSFEITGQTRMGRLVRVEHDVRIEVMRPSDVARLGEPLCPDPDVHIILPPLAKLRTITERLRPLSDVLAIRANGCGRLQLAVRTESVNLETQWVGCTNPKMTAPDGASQSQDADTDENAERDPDAFASVHVSLRAFLKFLTAHVVSSTTIACICQDHCVILYVYIGDVADAGGVLTFYIPAVSDD